jgi:3'-phosphoadenosine 5'-phosphosulfate sulfotransferase (PAPS reductase)/FAD synthetase
MGKDSLAMLLRLIEEHYPLDIVLFYNSGMEFLAIYRIRDRVKALCEEHGIRFVELHPDVPFIYSMLKRPVKYRDGSGIHYGYSWCGGRCRWATRHKLDAIHGFKESLGAVEIVDYVGIAADEKDRLEKEQRPDKIFPLVAWGMTEADCLAYCWRRGWHWYEESPQTACGYIDLYEILSRVSCWCCANKNERELYNIWLYLPQYWEWLKKLQSQTARPMKGYCKGQPKGVFELEKKFRLRNTEQAAQ